MDILYFMCYNKSSVCFSMFQHIYDVRKHQPRMVGFCDTEWRLIPTVSVVRPEEARLSAGSLPAAQKPGSRGA